MSDRICTVEGCDKPYRSKGYCNPHYLRSRIHGDPLGGEPMRRPAAGRVCTVDDCAEPVRSLGLCRVHYERHLIHGRLHLLSDEERFWDRIELGAIPETAPELGECWIWTGAKTDRGYGKGLFGGRHTSSHRYAYEQLRVEVPEGLHLDHLCRVTDCCNPWHLDPVTPAENNRRAAPYRQTKGGDAA